MPRRSQPDYTPLIIAVVGSVAAYLWRNPRLLRLVLIVAGIILVVALVAGVIFVLSGGLTPPSPPTPEATQPEGGSPNGEQSSPPDSSIHLIMGNPSGATDDPSKPDNYLMRKPYFALSYNSDKGTPNWVSWCLQASDIGSAPRAEFYPDLTLPRGFKQVKPADYSGGGFDRGHMCPHSDRSSSSQASEATFVMTNMVPQAPNCNQKGWADLEDYCRGLAKRKGQTLYIVAGPAGQGGEGLKGVRDTIGRTAKVTVPAQVWKVVLALDDGKGDASDVNRVTRDSRVFAVVMPNDQSVGHGWAKYRTSVSEVEKLTGYRFFDRVPADIIGPLKERVDSEHIPPGRRRRGDD
jgi:endonuclease G